MFSYIQPDSINLTSNHWFQVEYRHGKWLRFHVGVANLDMASVFLKFEVLFDFKLIVSGWIWACHVWISCLATFNLTRLTWNQIIGWRFILGMPSGLDFMWKWPLWICPRFVPLENTGAWELDSYVGLWTTRLLHSASGGGSIFLLPFFVDFSRDFCSFSRSFWSALSSASLTFNAFFRSSSMRCLIAFAFSVSSSMPYKSNISIPDSPTPSLDFLRSISKVGVKLGAQSRYQAPPIRWEIDQMRCWRAENMHAEFDLSSHVVKNTWRFSLEIALLARSSYLKYLDYKICNNIKFLYFWNSKLHNMNSNTHWN